VAVYDEGARRTAAETRRQRS